MSRPYDAIVIGSSSGGLKTLESLVRKIPANCIPIIIVQHIRDDVECFLADYLDKISQAKVKEAESNEVIERGFVYIAPPGYHLLIEMNKTLSLSVHERVNFSRPSIDVLFESAAYAYQHKLIGIILSGANSDGAAGLKTIKELNGLTIVENPLTAESPYMPEAAISATECDHVFDQDHIVKFILSLQV